MSGCHTQKLLCIGGGMRMDRVIFLDICQNDKIIVGQETKIPLYIDSKFDIIKELHSNRPWLNNPLILGYMGKY